MQGPEAVVRVVRQVRERQPVRGFVLYDAAAVLEDPAEHAKAALARYCKLLADYRRRAAEPDHHDARNLPTLNSMIANLEQLVAETDARALQLSGFTVCTS